MVAPLTTSTSSFLQAVNICKEYKNGERILPVLNGINFAVEKGEILVIVGASGAGKSTLLHILGILDSPTYGSVIYKDTDLTKLKPKKQAELRNRIFGFVFQFYHLLPDFTALENVLFPCRIWKGIANWKLNKKKYTRNAITLLEKIGMADRLTHKPHQLSGGERQRVAIVRALINEPELLLCDEPTGNLDTQTGNGIRELIWDLNKKLGQTVIIVTHDEEIAKYAKRIIRISDGHVLDSNERKEKELRLWD